ncbi:MAG: yfbR [Firmicutes bacterium]|nr:yfbR [Bacillota bacterium]
MLRKSLLELIYDGAHIQRWNDHIRPKGGFTELDKQAHKMIIAYILGKFETDEKPDALNWRQLIEGGIFEFLHRIVLTDIKPPVFHELMDKHGDQLNNWVLGQLKNTMDCVGQDFYEKFARYLSDTTYSAREKKLLKAAHYLATEWEFRIIYQLNSHIFGVEETKARIDNQLEEHSDLAGVQKIGLSVRNRNFIDLIGQLRFQQRWTQSPRVPETSVMGHMLIVAMLAYFCSVESGACDKRLVNNYLTGLFHDLPEVLTRDIVSPIKSSVEGLGDLIKQIETKQVEEKIFPLLPEAWRGELSYFIENEFANKIIVNGEIRIVKAEELGSTYNSPEYSPIDGEMIKGCDELAAYIEAKLSIAHGITSRYLREGAVYLYKKNANKKVAGIDFGQLFDYF